MGTKKKYLNICFMFFLVALFATFLGLFSSCYAMTENEYLGFLNEAQTILNNNNISNTINDIKSLNTTIYEDYNSILIAQNADNIHFTIYLYNNDEIQFRKYGSNSNQTFRIYNISGSGTKYLGRIQWINSTGTSYYDVNLLSESTSGYGLSEYNADRYGFSNIDIYIGTTSNVWTDETFYILQGTPADTISLIATKSGEKFTFSDKNQLQVNLTGDWSLSDFSFYVERYIDNEWQVFTDINDYYILANFENPYYIFWRNINYFPVGTYRYMADYLSLGEDLYYSDSFEITSSSSIVDGSVTGTIDNNGNVDVNVNIDNGKEVDNIKDFLGQEADFNNALNIEDIESAVDLDYISNPYENFIMTFLNGLISSFTDDASNLTFKVHTWGEDYTISVNDFAPNYNSDIRIFLTIFATICWSFVIVKWVTSIIDGLTHMSIQDCVDLIDAHYSNLF